MAGVSPGSFWLSSILMGPSTCPQILVDTFVLLQIDVSVTLPMAKGGGRAWVWVWYPLYSEDSLGLLTDHHKFGFLLVSFGFYQCPDSGSADSWGGFGSCGSPCCWNRECESVGGEDESE